jgi:hypothetical protein
VYGATILSSFLFLVTFTIIDKTKKDYVLVSLADILFFSILSSLPMPVIFIGFFLVPISIGYIRERYLPEPTSIVSIIYFFLSTLLFEGVLLLYLRAWNMLGILTLSWFIFINTFLGFLTYAAYLRIRKNFSAPEIKL